VSPKDPGEESDRRALALRRAMGVARARPHKRQGSAMGLGYLRLTPNQSESACGLALQGPDADCAQTRNSETADSHSPSNELSFSGLGRSLPGLRLNSNHWSAQGLRASPANWFCISMDSSAQPGCSAQTDAFAGPFVGSTHKTAPLDRG